MWGTNQRDLIREPLGGKLSLGLAKSQSMKAAQSRLIIQKVPGAVVVIVPLVEDAVVEVVVEGVEILIVKVVSLVEVVLEDAVQSDRYAATATT